MQCTLYIPYLLGPGGIDAPAWHAADAPRLKTLLARAHYRRRAEADATGLLCELFGVARQQDYPLAPLLAQQSGLPAQHGYWLCATPVHLQTQRTALVLTDPATLDLAPHESAALASTLAAHLRDENAHLHATDAARWVLQCATTPALITHNLDTAIAADARHFFPQGADSLRWQRLLTEMQMLLHAHPVNQARETRGQLPVNSVWLWGGGTLPARSPAYFKQVWSDHATVTLLARHTAIACKPALARLLPQSLAQGAHFFSNEALAPAQSQRNPHAWSDALGALERDWFAPLLQALKTRRVSTVTLISSDPLGTHHFSLAPGDLWKIWRNNRYLL